MRLRDYQERALREVKRFLEQLIVWRGKARQDDEWLFDFSEKAWEKARIGEMYLKKGWQKSRIYADFIFTYDGAGKTTGDYRKVFVLETKGLHLKSENTDYKKSVFALCNKHAELKTWNELVPAMQEKEITYEVVFQDEWERLLNQLLAS